MSDETLRELERRFRETGSVEDEAAWLWGMRQAGKLLDWRVEVAGHCRPELLGASPPPSSFAEWVVTFPFAGRRGRLRKEWARLPLATAHALAPVGEALGEGARLRSALEAAEDHFVAGGRDTQALEAVAEQMRWFVYELQPDSREETPPAVAIARCVEAALSFLLDPLAAEPRDLAAWAAAALEPEGVWGVEPGVDDAIEGCFAREGGRLWRLRRAVGEELASWALGYSDPVGARVEARRRAEAAGEG